MGSSWKMSSSLILCLSIFALLPPSSPSRVLPSSHSQKVSVGLYYETFCPTVLISSKITSSSSSRTTLSPSSISSSFHGVMPSSGETTPLIVSMAQTSAY